MCQTQQTDQPQELLLLSAATQQQRRPPNAVTDQRCRLGLNQLWSRRTLCSSLCDNRSAFAMSAVGSPADAAAAAVARGFSKIRIFIETLTGTTVTVDAHTSDTVNVLKARFRQIQGIPHHLLGIAFPSAAKHWRTTGPLQPRPRKLLQSTTSRMKTRFNRSRPATAK